MFRKRKRSVIIVMAGWASAWYLLRVRARRSSAIQGLEKVMMNDSQKIAGCSLIAESIRNSIFGDFYDSLIRSENAEIGVQPKRMPSPFIKPVETLCNASNVRPIIEGLPLTWLRVDRLDRWGVYYSVIALYGKHHWVVRDRSGAIFLRIFNESFN